MPIWSSCPGSKSTIADLAGLRAEGWDIDIAAHLRRGGRVLGLCGGYQMLGRRIADPQGIEGPAGAVAGLGLLDVDTELTGDKTLVEVTATTCRQRRAVRGYEMHIGRTDGADRHGPMLRSPRAAATARSPPTAGSPGCYLHGLFAQRRLPPAFLAAIRAGEASGHRL